MSALSRFGEFILRPPLVGFQGIAANATEAGLVALFVVLPALTHALGMTGFGLLIAVIAAVLVPIITIIPIHAVPTERGRVREPA
ncbi:MAG: hypothetical protein ACLFUX_07705 [Spirochaetaceae bacterium]